MFELQKYLDKLRNKSSSKIDTEYLLNIISKYEINKLDSRNEIELINKIKEYASADQWTNIKNIITNFNDNWIQRNSILEKIENELKQENYKKADEIIQSYIGALKVESQFIGLKSRYFKKSSIADEIKNRCFDRAYHLFKSKCNSDMIKEFNRYREESIDSIIKEIAYEASKRNLDSAEKIFSKYEDYISEDVYIDIINKYLIKFKEEMINELADKVYDSNFNLIEKLYNKKYTFIPYEEYFLIKKEFFYKFIKRKFASFEFEEAINLYKKNRKLISKQEYQEIRKKYSIIYIENELGKYKFEESDDFYKKNSSLLSNEEYERLKSKYKYKHVQKCIEEHLQIFEFNKADDIYDNNTNLIGEDEYFKTKKKYMNTYLEELLKAFEFSMADNIYDNNPNLIGEDGYLETKKKYMNIYLEELLKVFEFSRADDIYKNNTNLLDCSEYTRIKQNYVYKYLKEHLRKFEFSKADNIYNNYASLISNIEYQKIKNKYMNHQKQDQIEKNILELKRLTKYYKGVKQQKHKYEELIGDLKEFFRAYKDSFTDSIIEDIKRYKARIKFYNTKVTLLNINTSEPTSLLETVFYHSKEYYIGNFINAVNERGELDDNNINKQYKVKTTRGEIMLAYKKDLIEIGTFEKIKYESHCYRCDTKFDGNNIILERCTDCSWYLCPRCSACGCEYGGGLAESVDYLW